MVKEKRGGGAIQVNGAALTQDQAYYVQDRAVAAFIELAKVGSELTKTGTELLQATISVSIPGLEYPKVVHLANPNLRENALRELLVFLGSDPEGSILQSQIINQAAFYTVQKERAANCKACPDRPECDHPVEDEVVH